MRKDLGAVSAVFPMPVLMVSTYDKDGNIDVMNAAWGTQQGPTTIALKLSKTHKTVSNILETGFFTVGIADVDSLVACDYVGIVSYNSDPDKFKKSGLKAIKSEHVNAPIITNFPVVMECKFIEYQDDKNGMGVIGEIVNVSIDEKILDENGKVDPARIDAIAFDTLTNGYYSVSRRVGEAFKDGLALK